MPSNCAKQPGGRANDKHPRGVSIVQLPATVCALPPKQQLKTSAQTAVNLRLPPPPLDGVETCPAPPADHLHQRQRGPHQRGPWPGNQRTTSHETYFGKSGFVTFSGMAFPCGWAEQTGAWTGSNSRPSADNWIKVSSPFCRLHVCL